MADLIVDYETEGRNLCGRDLARRVRAWRTRTFDTTSRIEIARETGLRFLSATTVQLKIFHF